MNAEEKRLIVQSGDMLAWGRSRDAGIGRVFLDVVRVASLSEYGHVGVAVREGTDLYVVEATSPEVRRSLLLPEDSFYHVPMQIKAPVFEASYPFLEQKLGLKYSYLDALCGYLGVTLADLKRYQCAELTCDYYESLGIDLRRSYTPSRLVEAALTYRDTYVTWIPPLSFSHTWD